jgi:hypothetical protein
MTTTKPLDRLTPAQREVFAQGMAALDTNYRPPLLCAAPRSS